MHASAASTDRIAPGVSIASSVVALFTHEFEREGPRVAIPRSEIHLIVRSGSMARNGLDVHAIGGRQIAHRKLIRRGQRTVAARLRLGVPDVVLGASASAIAGRIVALEDLWGNAATERLCGRLVDARDAVHAASILQAAIAERLAIAPASRPRVHAELALEAARRLASANVSAVAMDLGVSERHLRRVFRETVGVSPKSFAKISRFHRALRAARDDASAGWASIAAAAGYYDQAHLIAEFRSIAGATPRALLRELCADFSLA